MAKPSFIQPVRETTWEPCRGAMFMSLIELRNIKKDYFLGETRVHALKGIDLTVEDGEFVAVWGPSGSGKTTLLNLIGAIDEPTQGA